MNKTISDRQRVMIVEDVGWIRAGMKRALEEYGYRVVEATDDEETVSLAERVRPGLILTEEEVPTFDSLTRRLCQHPSLRHVPIVIINPDAEAGTRYGPAVLLADYDQLERFCNPLTESPQGH
ncbi:MAG: response regulator [Pyrinomonadaceae bacterium]